MVAAATAAPAQVAVRAQEPEMDGARQEATEIDSDRRAEQGALGKEVTTIVVETCRPKPSAGSSSLPRHCHFCGRACGVFARLEFLRERRR
jgi:hypothetical protein